MGVKSAGIVRLGKAVVTCQDDTADVRNTGVRGAIVRGHQCDAATHCAVGP